MRSIKFNVALAGAGAGMLAAMTAQAQTAAPAAAEAELTEITITGSRVITNGNDAPTPVTVIAPEEVLVTKPSSLYENLADMPVFSGSRGASNGPVTTSPNAAGGNQPNGAVSSLNLRNMGPLRTLVLFDGRRVPPVSPDGLVDPSSLPQMLIQRVDVVTGGVSAVYGSDAITGVVNFVTDSKFSGVKTQLQYGTSQESDADSWQAGIAAGTDLFGGRGHIIGSFQRSDSDPLYDYDREWAQPRWGVYGNGQIDGAANGADVSYRLLPYVTNATATFGGSIACSSGANAGSVNPANCVGQPNVGLSFKQNGVLSAYNSGGARDGLTLATVQNGGDGAYFVNVAMKSAQTTDQFFTRFDYDLTDNVHAYVAGAWNSSKVEGNIGTQRTFAPGIDVSSCNAFLSAAVQAQLGCVRNGAGTITAEPTFRFEKQIDPRDNYGIGQNNRLKSKNYFVLAALNGQIGDGYRWDASYTRSEAELKVSGLNQNRQHIYASLDAVVNPANNQIVCRITLTNPTVLPGCIPINAFGPTAPSQAAISYWFDTINNTTKNQLDGLSASLSGSPLNSWAGPVDMALSAEFRKHTLRALPDLQCHRAGSSQHLCAHLGCESDHHGGGIRNQCALTQGQVGIPGRELQWCRTIYQVRQRPEQLRGRVTHLQCDHLEGRSHLEYHRFGDGALDAIEGLPRAEPLRSVPARRAGRCHQHNGLSGGRYASGKTGHRRKSVPRA
jgi:iron complex outermembrane recepter protein